MIFLKKSSIFSSYIFWNEKLKCSAWITFPVHLGAAEQTVNIFFNTRSRSEVALGRCLWLCSLVGVMCRCCSHVTQEQTMLTNERILAEQTEDSVSRSGSVGQRVWWVTGNKRVTSISSPPPKAWGTQYGISSNVWFYSSVCACFQFCGI